MSVTHVVIPAAGSAGIVWERAAELLPMHILPLPDKGSVEEMGEALPRRVEELDEARLLTGASLGAMVCLEVAKRTEVAGLVLIATGFGIPVGQNLLDLVASAPPDLFQKMARTSQADGDNAQLLATAVRDFEARGLEVVSNHLHVLAAYRPQPPVAPPPTLVLWGAADRAVPAAGHVELARQYKGILAPIPNAAHMPFLERPDLVVAWMRWAAGWATGEMAPFPRDKRGG